VVGQTTLSLSVNPVPWSKSKSKRTENSKETRGGGAQNADLPWQGPNAQLWLLLPLRKAQKAST